MDMNWYSKISKIAQMTPTATRESRYRGTITYEIRIPSSESVAEQHVADQAASGLFQKIQRVVGDEVVTYDLPNKIA